MSPRYNYSNAAQQSTDYSEQNRQKISSGWNENIVQQDVYAQMQTGDYL